MYKWNNKREGNREIKHRDTKINEQVIMEAITKTRTLQPLTDGPLNKSLLRHSLGRVSLTWYLMTTGTWLSQYYEVVKKSWGTVRNLLWNTGRGIVASHHKIYNEMFAKRTKYEEGLELGWTEQGKCCENTEKKT